MKCYFRISLVCFILLTCISLKAQEAFFEISENEQLHNVLKRLSHEYDLLFAYPSELIAHKSCRARSVSYEDLEDLFGQIFSEEELEWYEQDTGKILLRKSRTRQGQDFISGWVYDANNIPLELATIYYDDFSFGVFTDSKGFYKIPAPSDSNVELVISFLGFESIQNNASWFRNHRKHTLKYESVQLQEAIIEYILPPLQSGRFGELYSSSGDYTGSASASGLYGKDLMRYVQLLAGVSALDDNSVDLKIRGSNSDGSRIILDEMPLYNVNHYYGIFSAVNSGYVESFELYKNAQPVRYEGLSGGSLIMKSSGNNEKNNSIDINLLTASASFDLELTDNIDFKIAGRSSYRNVNDTRLLDLNPREVNNFTNSQQEVRLIESQPDFRFYDLNASLDFRFDKTRIKLAGFRSNDVLNNTFNFELNFPNNSFEKQLFVLDENWQNSAASLSLTQALNSETEFELVGYISKYNFESILDSELKNNMGQDFLSNSNENFLHDSGIRMGLKHVLDKHSLSYGIDQKFYRVEQLLKAENDNRLINYNESLNYWSFYGEYKLSIDKLNVMLASRLPVYNDRKQTRILWSPQVYFNYETGKGQWLKTSFSRTNQVLREFEYETRTGQSLSFFQLALRKEVPVLKSNNYMAGYKYEGNRWSIDLEFFYKKMNGSMLVSTSTPGFPIMQSKPGVSGFRVFIGDKRVYGLDFTLSHRIKNFHSWLAYTWSYNEDRYPQVFRNAYFKAQDDRRHQLKLINQYALERFDFNFNIIYASGRPYLALEEIGDRMERELLEPGEVLRNLPSYFRTDIGLDYNFNIKKSEASIGFSVFNLTNRQNVKYIQYSYRLNAESSGLPKNLILGTESELLNRTLNLNFNLSF